MWTQDHKHRKMTKYPVGIQSFRKMREDKGIMDRYTKDRLLIIS